MGVSLNDLVAELPDKERRAAELIAEEMSLRDLRKALGETQISVAQQLGIKQENVSRIERRSDMLLSTLNHYLRGLGGKLRLIAEFEGRPSVELVGLADLTSQPPGKTKRRSRSKVAA